ncbi:MAG: hypothetical protein J6Y08_10860 [Clostridiales bacterium]|nr:hypothetical protein [Clostridiales bacterium]
MFFFQCALAAEAKPLISALSLRKDTNPCPYDTYFAEDSSCVLAISGIGSLTGASSATYLLTRFGFRSESDFFINFGSCAGKNPGLYLINKITDSTTGRTFYPDMLYDLSSCGLPASSENALVTVDKIVSSLEDPASLYDMEASGIYQAASHFLSPHRILFLKYVSDSGVKDVKAITREYLTECAQKQIPSVLSVMEKLKDACDDDSAFDEELFLSTALALRASETMRHELAQLFRFAKAEDLPIEEILDSLHEEGLIPAASKREGKVVIDELKKRLI